MSIPTWVIARHWHGGETGARDAGERYRVPTRTAAERLEKLGHVEIDPDQSDAGDGSGIAPPEDGKDGDGGDGAAE